MAKQPQRSAHRPSRRSAIVDAAVKVFARHGFADTSIQTVATEAGVAPTAVYYHFSGKEELFEAALRQVLASVYGVVVAARGDDEPGDPETLAHVITAVWRWLEDNPDAGALMNHHLPGVTTRARAVQEEYESLHIARAFDYIAPAEGLRGRRSAAARHASETLAARTFIGLATLIHPMRATDGPLSTQTGRTVRAGLVDVATRILAVS